MDNTLDKGKILFAEGSIDEAKKCLQEILKSEPGNKKALNHIGVIALHEGFMDRAITCFMNALKSDPFYEEAIFNLCDVLKSTGQLHVAIPFLSKICQQYPNRDEFRRLLEFAVQTQTKEKTDKRQQKRHVLILVPQGWLVEECCVQPDASMAPGAALVLSAYLKKKGHRTFVQIFKPGQKITVDHKIDSVIVYSPWMAFTSLVAPVFRVFKKQLPSCTTILVMYESISDFEFQAMKSCPEIDYAVLPNEKEISVNMILEHGHYRCLNGFGKKTGIIYRDSDGLPVSSGKHPFARDLTHLPYAGNEIDRFLKQYAHLKYHQIAIVFQRGCPNPCTFCPLRNTRSRYRDPETVVDECMTAKKQLGPTGMWPMTLEVFRDNQALKEFSNILIAKNIGLEYSVGGRCEFVNDTSFLGHLKHSGLSALYLGIECATETMRKYVGKPIPDKDIETAIQLAKTSGLKYTLSFIMGFPPEDNDYMKVLQEMIIKYGNASECKRINLPKLVPFPGLPIEADLIKEGILDRKIIFDDYSPGQGGIINKASRTNFLDSNALAKWHHTLLLKIHKIGKLEGKRM